MSRVKGVQEVRNSLLRRYHSLPPVLRSAAATVRGGYLRFWRYGRQTDRLCDAALARERWTPKEWQNWRVERLAKLLHRAATKVPYYREQWSERRRRGDKGSWEVLGNWPLLNKETLRENPLAFIAEDRSVSRMFHDHTSGTTGKSIDLWLTRETVQSWYALFEARCRLWNGVSRHDRWAIIGGQLIAPVRQDEPPFWVWNASLRQLYLSAYHLAPRHTASYVEALRQYRIRYLIGYPSALAALAREVLAQKLDAPHLDVVLTNGEPTVEEQRREIETAFKCTVRETYGMGEIVAGASECEEGRMHLWPEAGVLEVIAEDGKAATDGRGEFVCTGLLNADMPLIRYRVGDRGHVPPSGMPCGCGRTLPVLGAIDGRVDDVLYTSDGRVVVLGPGLGSVFKSRLPIQETQIIQEALDVIRVRYVPAYGFSEADGQSVVDRIRDRLGPVKVMLEEVDSIARSANGKSRAVICNLSLEERERVRRG